MEKIEINTNKLQTKINERVSELIKQIQNNASNGKSITHLYIEKEIAYDVKSELEKQLKESGTNYDFMIVKRGFNKFTGRPESYISETIDNDKYYQIRIS